MRLQKPFRATGLIFTSRKSPCGGRASAFYPGKVKSISFGPPHPLLPAHTHDPDHDPFLQLLPLPGSRARSRSGAGKETPRAHSFTPAPPPGARFPSEIGRAHV